jgi:ribonucleoside-diphosphate reductase alpha chain
MDDIEMTVTKRSGKKETMAFDKIVKRLKTIGSKENLHVNYSNLAMKVIDQLYDGIKTSQIDLLSAEQCASLTTTHPDYGVLASHILISNHEKNTEISFASIMKELYNFRDIHGQHFPLICEELYNISQTYAEEIQNMIDFSRDYYLQYFGFKTLERAYLMRIYNKIVERPQHMWMRVSIGIHGNNLEKVKQTYDSMSNLYFTHATPTLFNAGTPRPQLSSCYLQAMETDSIEGIYNTLKDCAKISKWAGGIGLHIHNVRASGSHIRGTNGTSNGIVPMLRVFNNTARYVDQGGGKRNGSFAIYLEPWHSDIKDFLQMRKNHGDEEMKARDLFYALWIPDLFMKRVKENGKWTLMCPDECPGLSDVYGDKFEELYEKYENDNRGKKSINARELWFKLLDSQIETGTPYMLYKDAANKKSNQQNLGTIKSSNLCVSPETLILTDKGHIEIQTLKDEIVNVWNGKEFSEVIVKQTSDNSELITIDFSDGSELTCTKYHKFYIQTKYPTFNMKQDIIKSKSVSIVEAKDLKPDMKLIKCEYPIINSKEILKSSYTNGFFSGDGTYNKSKTENKKCNYKSQKNKAYCKRHLNNQKDNEISDKCSAVCYTDKPIVSLYGEKIKLLKYLDYTSYGKEINNKLNVTLSCNLKDKFFVPMNYSLASKLEWFSGYCDADGTIANNGNNQSLQVSSINKDFLIKIKLMLQTCGISSKVTKNMEERHIQLPDGKNGKKVYKCKKLWRLLVSSCDLQKLLELGFEPKRLIINKSRVQINATQFIKISSITNNNRKDKTFCFTEPKRHAGIFNGVITSQCTEIIEYSNEHETAVCNLASLGLSRFVREDKTFDYEHLHEITKIVTENLNKVIDINFYPTEKTRRSNMLHRPIGIGVQGLADVFALMDIPFESDDAKKINKNIFETIYHGALEKSMEISKERKEDLLFLVEKKKGWSDHKKDYIEEKTWTFSDFSSDCQSYKTQGAEIKEKLLKHNPTPPEIILAKQYPNFAGSYSSIEGSPISKGIFQFDLWGVTPSDRYDWNKLKEQVKENGVRNSLLLAPMPTASTSQILGNNECFEPFTSNIYIRRTNAGEFVIVNKYLLKELLELGIWSDQVKNSIIANNGSIQHLEVSDHMKQKYKTAWEISMKHLIDMSRDRGAFICQSQSLNLWVEEPNYGNLTSMHFYAWEQGLKTGLYYLRTRAKAKPQQFTIEPEKNQALVEEEPACEMCSA